MQDIIRSPSYPEVSDPCHDRSVHITGSSHHGRRWDGAGLLRHARGRGRPGTLANVIVLARLAAASGSNNVRMLFGTKWRASPSYHPFPCGHDRIHRLFWSPSDAFLLRQRRRRLVSIGHVGSAARSRWLRRWWTVVRSVQVDASSGRHGWKAGAHGAGEVAECTRSAVAAVSGVLWVVLLRRIVAVLRSGWWPGAWMGWRARASGMVWLRHRLRRVCRSSALRRMHRVVLPAVATGAAAALTVVRRGGARYI